MVSVRQKKQSTTKSWLFIILFSLSMGLALSLAVWGVYWLWCETSRAHFFAFRRVRVVMKAQHLQDQQITEIVKTHLQGGFFSLRTQSLREALVSEPWVAGIEFRREWPDLLEVDIEEQKPVACWNSTQLVTAHGKLFIPEKNTMPRDLPLLLGPPQTEEQVLENFLRFQKWLSPLNMKIARLELTKSRSWLLILTSGLEVRLGHEQVEERIKKFVAIYPDIMGKNKSTAICIDMRYPNGIAVRWN